jgi:hypothetical protein
MQTPRRSGCAAVEDGLNGIADEVASDPGVMLRPRVKPEHAPYRLSGGRIRIGGVSYGIAAEISDPDGFVR